MTNWMQKLSRNSGIVSILVVDQQNNNSYKHNCYWNFTKNCVSEYILFFQFFLFFSKKILMF